MTESPTAVTSRPSSLVIRWHTRMPRGSPAPEPVGRVGGTADGNAGVGCCESALMRSPSAT